MKCPNCDHIIKKDKKILYAVVEDENNKLCSKCHTMKPLTEYDKVNPKKSDKLRGECKACRKIINAEMYKARREKATIDNTN
jgi:hypothetical protein